MLSPIKSNIAEKLKDKGYRDRFFRGRANDEIAYSIRRFRKIRGLNQTQLAQITGMKQSAISRIEQASYSKWSFNTLWRIFDALDIRVRVKIDDMSDAIREYEEQERFEQGPEILRQAEPDAFQSFGRSGPIPPQTLAVQ